MKKFLIATVMLSMFFASGCNLNLSNLDVQKLNNKAAEYMQAGEYDKAASRLEAIIDLNPDLPETYYNLGIAYYQMSEYSKATEALSNALIRRPEFADAYYSRALAYEDMAYIALEPDNDTEKKQTSAEEDKAAAKEFFENAKSDFENYLKFKQDAKDKADVEKRIEQIIEKLNEGDIKK